MLHSIKTTPEPEPAHFHKNLRVKLVKSMNGGRFCSFGKTMIAWVTQELLQFTVIYKCIYVLRFDITVARPKPLSTGYHFFQFFNQVNAHKLIFHITAVLISPYFLLVRLASLTLNLVEVSKWFQCYLSVVIMSFYIMCFFPETTTDFH